MKVSSMLVLTRAMHLTWRRHWRNWFTTFLVMNKPGTCNIDICLSNLRYLSLLKTLPATEESLKSLLALGKDFILGLSYDSFETVSFFVRFNLKVLWLCGGKWWWSHRHWRVWSFSRVLWGLSNSILKAIYTWHFILDKMCLLC